MASPCASGGTGAARVMISNVAATAATKTRRAVDCSRTSRPHSLSAMITTTASSAEKYSVGSASTPHTNSGSRTRAVSRRCLSTFGLFHLLPGAAEATLAADIRGQGLVAGPRIEIGPEGIGEVQYRIGEMPQQKIADALFAAGADEEIGLGQTVQGELALEQVGGDVGGAKFAGLDACAEPARRLRHVPAPAVIGGDHQREAGVLLRQRLGGSDLRLHARFEGLALPHHLEAHVVLVQFLGLALLRSDEQLHQQAHLVLRAAPVFAAEGEQGEDLDALFPAGAHHLPHHL